ncbi:UNVERIFIED_CONTAM: arginine deiminase [Brevibacillus sp. OAP136]
MKYGSQSMVGKLESVFIKRPAEAFISQEHLEQNWQAYNYTSCPDYAEAVKEYEAFEAILRKHVPNVVHLPQSDLTGLDSLYAHDSVKITRNGAILLKSGKTLRQGEPQLLKQVLAEHGIPVLGELTGEARADGGDIVWLDERTVVVGRGYRTNDEGIRQLRELMADVVDEFIVVHLPHANGPEECLHLMSFISMVSQDLAVVHSPLMPVMFREMLLARGMKLIEVPEAEYNNLGCNVLALAPRIVMIPAGNPHTKAAMEAEGVTVYEYKGDEISYKGTGGPTCLTCPVERL